MRIGIVTNSYPPNLNGVSKAVYNLSEALQKAGCEVYIVTPKVPGVQYPDNILPVLSAPAPGHTSKDLRVPINFGDKIYKFFKKHEVDILHSQDTFMGGLDTVFLANKLKIPCVHTYHTMVENYDYFKFPGYRQFIRSYSQMVCDGHDAVIGLSKKVTDYLLDIGVTTKIYQLPNIFLTPSAKHDLLGSPYRFITEHNLQNTQNIITFGRVAKEKNLFAAIEQLLPYLIADQNLRYIIAGDGPDLESLKSQVAEEGLERQILFYGAYNYGDLQSLSKVCKLFLITSYSEVQPTTPLEAMSLGLPIVSVCDAAYEYLLQDGSNALCRELSNVGQSVHDLLSKPKELAKLQKNSKKTYKNYIAHDWTQDYIKTYLEIIDNYQTIPLIKTFLLKNVEKMGLLNGMSTISEFVKR